MVCAACCHMATLYAVLHVHKLFNDQTNKAFSPFPFYTYTTFGMHTSLVDDTSMF